jgi:hypothetical protein
MSSVWCDENDRPYKCSRCGSPVKALWSTDEGRKVFCSQRCLAAGLTQLFTYDGYNGIKVRSWGRASKDFHHYYL